MHRLGDVEELLRAADHLPLGTHADVGHERYERAQDLRYPAAEGGGVDVQDARALQRLGQAHDLLVSRVADDRPVRRQ
jgi:hypothetical protein